VQRLGCVIALSCLLAAEARAQGELAVEGTEFVLSTADGRRLRSRDLVGAVLRLGEGSDALDVEIERVEEDRGAVGGRVWLHRLIAIRPDGARSDYCEPDAEGRSLGFPVPDEHGGFSLTCTSGAIGKCILWGYRPWEERPDGAPLRALHRACVHMVRADYGGDGRSATRPGIAIEFHDRHGIRRPNPESQLAFEAAWGPDGATCVARPRLPLHTSLGELALRYPQLSGRLGNARCSESDADRDPAALLFNRSPAP
jgi:hypothetical protein